MCGIFGFAGMDQPGLVERMGEALAHRGPDSVGYLRTPNLHMGARRLKIIDPDGGDQPIMNEDGSVVVCQNGEIYNYVELREELAAQGHRFETNSDTEVLAHGYEEWGENLLDHLNGMFAFAIWDGAKRQLFLARDRCGQKPLYYWTDGRVLVFASEIKALLANAAVPREPCRHAIDSYLRLRYVPEPTTMFDDIQTLQAGHCLTWHKVGGTGKPAAYWRVPQASSTTIEGIEDGLGDLLDDSVKLALRSDVEVGAYLSGGVDSSLLVESMSRQQHGIHTFSIGFGTDTDETQLAAATAKRLGTTHHEVQCTANDVAELLPKVVYHMDRPVGDALTVAFYKLAQAARNEVKVVLSGEGADELFAGYPFHRAILSLERLRGRYGENFAHEKLPSMIETVPVALLNRLNAFPAYLGDKGRAKVANFMRDYPDLDLWEQSIGLRTLFERHERKALYDGASFGNAYLLDPVGMSDYPESDHPELLDRLLELQWREWLQDWALIRQDKNAMAHGLEVRIPFLDHRLIDLAFQLPPSRKMSGKRDKIALRDLAAKRLPASTARQKKIPFHLPIEHFLENKALSDMISDNLDRARVRRRGYFDPAVVSDLVSQMGAKNFVATKQVMSLVILELWHRTFIDGESFG